MAKQHTDTKETALKNCQKLLQLLFHCPESLLCCSSLLQAFEIQQRTLKRVPLEQPGSIFFSEKAGSTDSWPVNTEHCLSRKDYLQAIKMH